MARQHGSSRATTDPGGDGDSGKPLLFVTPGTAFADEDFVRSNASAPDNGIHRIDHVAETVRDSDFLSTTLFYRALLGLDVEEAVDLIDPNGIVYSRLARSPSGRVRLPFNTSHSWGTSSRRFIEHTRGGACNRSHWQQTISCERCKESILGTCCPSRRTTTMISPPGCSSEMHAPLSCTLRNPVRRERIRRLPALLYT